MFQLVTNNLLLLLKIIRTLQHLEEVAVLTAKNLASGSLKINRQKSLTDRALKVALGYNLVKDQIFNKAKAQVMKQTNGLYPAPLKVLLVSATHSSQT